MRLIDADKIIRNRNCQKDCETCDFARDGDSWCSGGLYIVNILKAPTIDAIPVAHGHWILHRPRVNGRNATYKCSVCGKLRSSYYNDVQEWEFCPCGAKMDEVDKR